jgi:PPOX class probable F420-dependent enzyme
MKNVPADLANLLDDQARALLYLATTMADGSPQVTPVWFNTDGEHILINTAKGRVKDRNMRARPLVAACIQDPADPYRYLQLRGRVVEFREQGALEHIEALARKYTGRSWRGAGPGEVRVIYRIRPFRVDAHA